MNRLGLKLDWQLFNDRLVLLNPPQHALMDDIRHLLNFLIKLNILYTLLSCTNHVRENINIYTYIHKRGK